MRFGFVARDHEEMREEDGRAGMGKSVPGRMMKKDPLVCF